MEVNIQLSAHVGSCCSNSWREHGARVHLASHALPNAACKRGTHHQSTMSKTVHARTRQHPARTISGLYCITNFTTEGFPTYEHEKFGRVYFFYNSSRRVLTLGDDELLAQTSGRLPWYNDQYPYSQVITRWSVLHLATKRFALCTSFAGWQYD